jgi:hypothetical protein
MGSPHTGLAAFVVILDAAGRVLVAERVADVLRRLPQPVPRAQR